MEENKHNNGSGKMGLGKDSSNNTQKIIDHITKNAWEVPDAVKALLIECYLAEDFDPWYKMNMERIFKTLQTKITLHEQNGHITIGANKPTVFKADSNLVNVTMGSNCSYEYKPSNEK